MKGILITSDNCEPCQQMKKEFADLLASGEIEEKNLEKDGDEVTILMNKYQANLPSLLIVADNGDLILSI
jgi:hypothetical protein